MKTAAGVTYSYDGDGRRAAKVGSKLYWYGSGGEILGETNAAGTTLNEYIFFGGRRVALVPATGSALYYAADLLGSSRVMVQSNGMLCYDADFTPFGAERSITSTCAQNSYKFEGKERDAETGNDDFGAREYSWRMGRWLSSDWSAVPVAVPYANLTNPQTLNLYAMVADDPESFADLDGHGENSPGPTDKTQTCETFDGCAQSHAPQPAQEKIDPTLPVPPPPPTPDPANVRGNPPPASTPDPSKSSDSPTTSSPSDQTQAPMESRARGKGERRQTSKPDEPAKRAKPIRDKNGKITGWRLPTPDGKGKDKSLTWGRANGLDPSKFQTATKVGVIGAAAAAGAYIISTAPEWGPVLGALAF